MSALILYCATSMLHVPHRHAPDLIDMVVPVSHLTRRCHLRVGYVWYKAAFSMYIDHRWLWFSDQLAVFRPNFVQNCEFRFSSKMLNFAIWFVFRPKRIFFVPTNEEIRKRTGQTLLEKVMRERRLRWLGHVTRMDEVRIPKQTLQWEVVGFKRRPGRPRINWRYSEQGPSKTGINLQRG